MDIKTIWRTILIRISNTTDVNGTDAVPKLIVGQN